MFSAALDITKEDCKCGCKYFFVRSSSPTSTTKSQKKNKILKDRQSRRRGEVTLVSFFLYFSFFLHLFLFWGFKLLRLNSSPANFLPFAFERTNIGTLDFGLKTISILPFPLPPKYKPLTPFSPPSPSPFSSLNNQNPKLVPFSPKYPSIHRQRVIKIMKKLDCFR